MRAIIGKVVSDKMNKTVVVEAGRLAIHPKYHKRVKRTQKFHAHNELGVKVGDLVKIVAIRPVSATKSWKVMEKI